MSYVMVAFLYEIRLVAPHDPMQHTAVGMVWGARTTLKYTDHVLNTIESFFYSVVRELAHATPKSVRQNPFAKEKKTSSTRGCNMSSPHATARWP